MRVKNVNTVENVFSFKEINSIEQRKNIQRDIEEVLGKT